MPTNLLLPAAWVLLSWGLVGGLGRTAFQQSRTCFAALLMQGREPVVFLKQSESLCYDGSEIAPACVFLLLRTSHFGRTEKDEAVHGLYVS